MSLQMRLGVPVWSGLPKADNRHLEQEEAHPVARGLEGLLLFRYFVFRVVFVRCRVLSCLSSV